MSYSDPKLSPNKKPSTYFHGNPSHDSKMTPQVQMAFEDLGIHAVLSNDPDYKPSPNVWLVQRPTWDEIEKIIDPYSEPEQSLAVSRFFAKKGYGLLGGSTHLQIIGPSPIGRARAIKIAYDWFDFAGDPLFIW
jgi:hypothetical protein